MNLSLKLAALLAVAITLNSCTKDAVKTTSSSQTQPIKKTNATPILVRLGSVSVGLPIEAFAFDAAGTEYAISGANYNTSAGVSPKTVYRVVNNGGTPIYTAPAKTIGNNGSTSDYSVSLLATDSKKNVYTLRNWYINSSATMPFTLLNSQLTEISPDGKISTPTALSMGMATDIAVDSVGTIYVAMPDSNFVRMIAFHNDSPVLSSLARGDNIKHLAISKTGNMYVATSNVVVQILPGGKYKTLYIGHDIGKMVTDAKNNLFVISASTIVIISPDGSHTVVPLDKAPVTLAIDANNRLYSVSANAVTAYAIQ